MRMFKIAFLPVFLCLIQSAFAQAPCYESVRQNGINLLKGTNPNYAEALNKFWAAFECFDKPADHDLNLQIRKAHDLSIVELTNLVKEAQAAEKLAQEARVAEKSAKEAAVRNYELAEEKRKEARKKGIIAESLRLAALSSAAGQRGEKSEALHLAFLATVLGKEAPQLPLNKAFFEAARDSFSKDVSAGEKIENFSFGTGGVLAESGEKAFIFSKANPERKIEISGPEKVDLQFKTNPKTGDFAVWGSKGFRVFDHRGKFLGGHSKHTEPILNVGFSGSGEKVITASRDNSIVILDLKSGSAEKIEAHDGNVYDVEFSAGDQLILTRSSDGSIRIWNRDGSMKSEIMNTDSYFYQGRFSPDGKNIITGSADGTVGIRNTEGKLLKSIDFAFNAPIIKTAFLDGGRKIAALSLNGKFAVSDFSGKILFKEINRLAGFRVLENGRELLLWQQNFSLKKLDSEGETLMLAVGHQTPIIHAEASPGGKYLLSTSAAGRTVLWDRKGNILTSWTFPAEEPLPSFFDEKGETVIIPDVANHKIIVSPIPALILEEFYKNKDKHILEAKALQTEYDIQFTEEL